MIFFASGPSASVRLEENGLVSALEELAANSGAPFQVSCAFSSQQPPEVMDNGVALHLYYLKSATEVILQAIQWSREEAPK